MSISDWVSEVSRESKRLFLANPEIVNAYNYSTLVSFALVSMSIFLLLFLISFIPAITIINTITYHVFFGISFGEALALHILSKWPAGLAKNHPSPFLYALLLIMHVFGVVLNLLSPVPIPYTITLGFLLLVPILLLDLRSRNIAINAFVFVVAMALSFFKKPFSYFMMDVINCGIFAIVGVIMGDICRYNQILYMTMKERELDTGMAIMKAKNEAKSAFLANISHEIRTPINAILGMNEMILRESSEKGIRDYAASVRVAGRNLLALVNDILDYSKIEANKLQILSTEYCLDSTINDLVSMILPRAKEKKLRFDVQVDPSIPDMLYGDEVRLKQCVLNLLTNAVKYTNEGVVTLAMGWEPISDKSMLLKVRVSDTGIGIKEEDIPSLYAAFERIDEAHHRNVEGTGLGMAIVLNLLEKMNSSLSLKSEWGKGSTFSFNLQQGIVDPQPIGDYEKRLRDARAREKSYRESFHAPDAHILVIDDMKMNLDVIRALLKSTQIQVDVVQSGEQALQMVQLCAYDIIFIDHRMPGMDGIETVKALHALKVNKSAAAPCVALTANAVPGAREQYLNAGFVDYITKPIDYAELEALLIRSLPAEKIQMVSPSGEEPPATAPEEDDFVRRWSQVEDIDGQAAFTNCGDPEVLQIAANEYYRTISQKADDLERFMNEADWRNYTVLVHAIKSSSRLVGALALSEEAAYLEQCGDAGKIDEIRARTPALLEQYRGYIKKMAPACAQEKPALSDPEFDDVLGAVREFVSAGDVASLGSIVSMMEQYALTDGQNAVVKKITECLRLNDLSLLSGQL